MKSNLKIGFMAFVFALCLSACDFLSKPKTVSTEDSTEVDSLVIDSAKNDTTAKKLSDAKPDSVAKGK